MCSGCSAQRSWASLPVVTRCVVGGCDLGRLQTAVGPLVPLFNYRGNPIATAQDNHSQERFRNQDWAVENVFPVSVLLRPFKRLVCSMHSNGRTEWARILIDFLSKCWVYFSHFTFIQNILTLKWHFSQISKFTLSLFEICSCIGNTLLRSHLYILYIL